MLNFRHLYVTCVLLSLFGSYCAQLWNGAHVTTADDEQMFVNTDSVADFAAAGLYATVSTPDAASKVYLMVTANFRSTLDNSQMYVTIYRDDENLVPVAMAVVDATKVGEHYPITFTFIDTPGSIGSHTYTVKAYGDGILSHGNSERSLFYLVLNPNYPAASVVATSSLTINSATPVTLGTATLSNPIKGAFLVGATSTYNPVHEGGVTQRGSFSLQRGDGTDLGGSKGLVHPNSPLKLNRRTVSILYLEADVGAHSYSLTAQQDKFGDHLYYSGGTEDESRIVTAVAMPPTMAVATSSLESTVVSSTAWTPVGLSVTVQGSLSATKVLVTVNIFASALAGSPNAVGHFTIFRNGANLGHPTVGMQTVGFVYADTGTNRESTFFFVDELAGSSDALEYTLMCNVEDADTSIAVSQDGVKSQIGAIVVTAGTGAAPAVSAHFHTAGHTAAAGMQLAATTALDTFMTSPTYTVSPGFAFAARNTEDGKVWTWGQLTHTSSASTVATIMRPSGASSLVASRAAYAHMNSDGSTGAFGVAALTEGSAAFTPTYPFKFASIVSNDAAFAGIAKTGGRVLAFGSNYNGGDVVNNAECNGYAAQLSSGVVSIVASSAAFAALKADGTVYAWGNKYAGGGVSSETRQDLVGVQKLFATATAFAALLTSGAVKVWGDRFGGGSSTSVASSLTSGVLHIVASRSVFVAYKADTSIVVWGGPYFTGGVTPAVAPLLSAGIKFVTHNPSSWAALKTDGSVVAWGDAKKGGDTSAVSDSLVNIAALYSNRFAFAALTSSGGVVAWGDAEHGGVIPSDLTSILSNGVTAIFSTHRAFAALKGSTGQLILWGNPFHGAVAGAVASYLSSGVRTVCANDAAFTAILQDGRAVAWGHPSSIPNPGLVQNAPSFNGVTTCAVGSPRAVQVIDT